MKFEKLKPGITVYSVRRHKMGNTTMTTVAVWKVRIIEVDEERRRVVASWNGNKAQTFYEGEFSKWREREPLLIGTLMGGRRLATREEKAAFRAASAMKDTTAA